MENSNVVKAQILGMPFGTANGRLRKKLVFHLAKKLEMLNCYRCGQLIDSIEEFSIEHIKSWQYSKNPVESFFDVENIAFSHLDCNVRAANHPKIESPEGMSWCGGCKAHKPVEEFAKGKRHNGLGFECRECNTTRRLDLRVRTGRR